MEGLLQKKIHQLIQMIQYKSSSEQRFTMLRKNDIVYISAYGNKLEIKTLNGIINCYEPKSFEGQTYRQRAIYSVS